LRVSLANATEPTKMDVSLLFTTGAVAAIVSALIGYFAAHVSAKAVLKKFRAESSLSALESARRKLKELPSFDAKAFVGHGHAMESEAFTSHLQNMMECLNRQRDLYHDVWPYLDKDIRKPLDAMLSKFDSINVKIIAQEEDQSQASNILKLQGETGIMFRPRFTEALDQQLNRILRS
jgi:hypothetical protein